MIDEQIKTISINDWFDITNKKHLKAYENLVTTGCWPKNFIPKNIEIIEGWQGLIMAKMANAFVEMKLR